MDPRLGLDLILLLFGAASGWQAQKSRANSAHHSASEALRKVEAAHKRIDAHGERLTRLETNVLNQADLVKGAIARLETSISTLTSRIDAVLAQR